MKTSKITGANIPLELTNIITPNVVEERVSINPFAAIVALFWRLGMGALGIILSIPILAIIKVV